MKAKMTEHDGVYFRSKLEARWCKFFEFLGVTFEYEPSNKSTSVGGYIPDFYFKSLKTWVEIKGVKPTLDEIIKLKDVCIKTNQSGFIISGYPSVYPFSYEPHTANCTCYFISKTGVGVEISLDEIYQISKNTRILHALEHCKPSSMIKVDLYEWQRYAKLKPAKATFKANKTNFLTETKKVNKVFTKLSKRFN